MVRSGIRALVAELAAGVRPHDAREAADQADILAWVALGQPLFRTAAPATPPKHLVVYFVPADTAGRGVLLGDHRKSGLWLPPGGHVEDGEDPRQAVRREADEELGISAEFHPGLGGESPFFLTVTPTIGPDSHLDVDLWFALRVGRETRLTPDPREFNDVRWFDLDQPTWNQPDRNQPDRNQPDWNQPDRNQSAWNQPDQPSRGYDPEMGRFAAKLRSALSPPPR
jgi:8-oxo-dGTP pyrophosphatase MutT (NUDIX family)